MINTYVALDLETTGLDPKNDRIIEIGAAKVIDGVVSEHIMEFINPEIEIPQHITKLTGISSNMTKNGPVIGDIIQNIVDFCEGYDLLGHNILFDYSFLHVAARANGIQFSKNGIDTHKIAKRVIPDIYPKTLENLCDYYNINVTPRHRAYSDALAASELYKILAGVAPEDKCFTKSEQLIFREKVESPITRPQVSYLTALVARYGIELGKEIGSLTKSEASRTIDLIISEHGRS